MLRAKVKSEVLYFLLYHWLGNVDRHWLPLCSDFVRIQNCTLIILNELDVRKPFLGTSGLLFAGKIVHPKLYNAVEAPCKLKKYYPNPD